MPRIMSPGIDHIKPMPWAFSVGDIDPAWLWFWQPEQIDVGSSTVHMPAFVIPFWEHSISQTELISHLSPAVEGSGWSFESSPWGSVLRTSGGSTLRYAPNVGTEPVYFNETDKWSAVVVCQLSSTTHDESTLFGYSTWDPDTATNRQLWVNTDSVSAPVSAYARGGSAGILANTGAVIELNTWYAVAVTHDPDEGQFGELRILVFDLQTGEELSSGTGTMFNTSSTVQLREFQFGSHFSAVNDDMQGDLLVFYYLPGRTLTDMQLQQLVRDPFGPVRQRYQINLVETPGPTGPPVGSLALLGVGI